MKRIVLSVLAAGMILSIGSVTAFAAGRHNGYTGGFCRGSGVCQNHVDLDCDGFCDDCAYVCVEGCGSYADADGDGACDNRTAGACAGHHNCGGEGCRKTRCGANRR